MGFIKSANIQVFPCGRRANNMNATARLTTEYNLVSIINRLVDKESFIVTDVDFSSNIVINDTTLFSFNIGGYLFTTSIKDVFDAAGVDSSKSGFILATIKSESISDTQRLVELQPLDDKNITATIKNITYTFLDQVDSASGVAGESATFVGVEFSLENPIPKNSKGYTILPLFEKRSDGWYFVEDSKIKFETNTAGTHRSVKIDDGILG